jgi:hypothetical protein
LNFEIAVQIFLAVKLPEGRKPQGSFDDGASLDGNFGLDFFLPT